MLGKLFHRLWYSCECNCPEDIFGRFRSIGYVGLHSDGITSYTRILVFPSQSSPHSRANQIPDHFEGGIMVHILCRSPARRMPVINTLHFNKIAFNTRSLLVHYSPLKAFKLRCASGCQEMKKQRTRRYLLEHSSRSKRVQGPIGLLAGESRPFSSALP